MPSLSDDIRSLGFTSIPVVGMQFRRLNYKRDKFGPAVGEAYRHSPTKAYLLARGMLMSARDVDQAVADARILITWASEASPDERFQVTKAIRTSGDNLFMVHEITRLPRQKARLFMADYFASGGDMKAVARWLQISGHVLREHRVKRPATAGWWADATEVWDYVCDEVEDWKDDTVEKVTESIETLIDAIENGGKSVADVVEAAKNWALEEVADFVEALFEADEKVADILNAAWNESTATLEKFVKAMIEAGKTAGEILAWAVRKTQSVIEVVIEALHDVSITYTEMLEWAAAQAAAITDMICNALIAVGRTVSDLLKWTKSVSFEVLKAIVSSLLRIGQTLSDVVGAAVNWALDEVGVIVEALFEAGKTVAMILNAALSKGTAALKKFVKAMMKAGKTVSDILSWAVKKTQSVIETVIQALHVVSVTYTEMLKWAAAQVTTITDKICTALIAVGRTVSHLLRDANSVSFEVLKAIVSSLLRVGQTLSDLVRILLSQSESMMIAVVKALMEIGKTAGELLEAAANAVSEGAYRMAKLLIKAGQTISELVLWVVEHAASLVNDVIRGIIDAGKGVRELLMRVSGRAFSVLKAVVQALFDLGYTFEQLLKYLITVPSRYLSNLIKAAIDLGKSVSELVRYAFSLTAINAQRLIAAALRAGVTIAELLAEVGTDITTLALSKFRKMVEWIIKANGSIEEVLGWISTQTGYVAPVLWPNALSTIRSAGGKLTAALDWGLRKSEAALEIIVKSWKTIGEALEDVYEWAKGVAEAGNDLVWEVIGTITVKLENSVHYVLEYLENDFVPGIQKFVKGILKAGYDVAQLVAWMATRSLEIVVEVVAALLDFGLTLGELLVLTAQHPNQVLSTLLQAAQAAGKTLADIYQAVIIETGGQFLTRVTLLLFDLGETVKDILDAVAEVSLGTLGVVVSIFLNTLGSYRPLNDNEKEDARVVYGDSIDLEKVYISVEDITNKVIFGLQDWANNDPDSRAFVTNNLINFDVAEGITRATLIHELCHVWQFEVTGPFYFSEAIHANIQGGGSCYGPAYNYGYTNDIEGCETGKGAESALAAANGNFDAFNREQQAKIAEHYFVRKVLENLPQPDYAAWQPYINVIQA